MTLWVALVAMLLGVNLVRIIGRGFMVATCVLIALVVLAVSGLITVMDWGRFLGAAVVVSLGIVAWARLALSDKPVLQFFGLLTLVVSAGTQVILLPVSMGSKIMPWVWLVGFLLLAEPTNRFLRWCMGLLGKPLFSADDRKGVGEVIGVLERWIMVLVLVRGEYSAMAFILAAKTLARHKRFEDDSTFAEYFLVGTLASILMAIAVAEGIRFLS